MRCREKWLFVVCSVLLCLNLCFIWGNSSLPGEASREVSGNALNQYFTFFAVFGAKAEKILRKVAHFSEFASLGFLFAGWFTLLKAKNTVVDSLLCCMTAACIDETIQLFVSGRNSSVLDVWIDMLGVAAGIILLQVGYSFFRKR